MDQTIQNEQWIYVVAHGPSGNEHLLGQQDLAHHISFIPIFLKKEDALMNINLLAREEGSKYEVQAMLYEDLVDRIRGQGFMIFVLDEAGAVLEKITPF